MTSKSDFDSAQMVVLHYPGSGGKIVDGDFHDCGYPDVDERHVPERVIIECDVCAKRYWSKRSSTSFTLDWYPLRWWQWRLRMKARSAE